MPGGRAGLLERRRLRVRHRADRADHARPDRRRARPASASELDGLARRCEPVDPAYRAYFPDGSTLDVHADVDAMAAEIARGLRAGRGRRLPALRRLRLASCTAARCATSSTATSTRPLDLLTPDLARLAAIGGFRRLAPKVGAVPRATRGPSGSSRFQAMYAGLVAVRRARDLRRHRLHGLGRRACSSRAAACTPCRGRWPARPRSTASSIRYGTEVTRVERAGGRAVGGAHRRRRADRLPTSWCSTPTCRSPTATCSAASRWPVRRLRYSPSCFLLLAGSTRGVHADRAPQHPLRRGLAGDLRRADPRAAG